MNQNRNRPSSVDRVFKCPKCNQILDNSLKNDHLLCHMLDEDEKIRHNNRNRMRVSQENRPNRNQNDRNRMFDLIEQTLNRHNENNNINIRLNGNLYNLDLNRILNYDTNNNFRRLFDFSEDSHLIPFFNRRNHNRDRNHRDNRDSGLLSFPEIVIEDINKLEEANKSCVICLEEFKSKEKVTALPCLHYFHTNCIKKWMERKNDCPICKFKLTKENIDRKMKYIYH